MRIVCISDTHLGHEKLVIPDGDILIHSGDVIYYNRHFKKSLEEYISFIGWFGKHKHKYKIIIAGNHDVILDNKLIKNDEYKKEILELFKKNNITYLENSGINIQGIKIYGSPNTNIKGMAFGEDIDNLNDIWGKIPDNTDILITHTPPHSILDNNFGDKLLLNKIKSIMPKYHLFGHIHEAYGYKACSYNNKKTIFINASIEKNNLPIAFTYNII